MGFLEQLKAKGVNHTDFGDMQFNLDDALLAYENVYVKTLEILNKKHTPFLIGGDHSQAFASISALLDIEPDLRILWVDAHGDVNTPETSPSGNWHGMPLAGLMGLVDKDHFQMPWLKQNLKPQNIVHIGVRDVDSGELEIMKDNNMEYYTAKDVREKGMSSILKDVHKRWGNAKTHISFDIDGMDSSIVSATGTPVADGLNLSEAIEFVQTSKELFNLFSCEVVEFNPRLAKTEKDLKITEETVKKVLFELLS